jgi:hypothetical protein
MKYGQTIRDLAVRGQNWPYYDENFRCLRRTQASLVPWGSIHGELWLRSQYPVRAPPPNKQMSGISKTVGHSVDFVSNFTAVSFVQLAVAVLSILALNVTKVRIV